MSAAGGVPAASERLRGDLALLACAIGWGTTFPLTRLALEDASPLVLVAARFLLAALLLLRWGFYPDPRGLVRALPVGLWLGLLLTGGYALQTYGLTLISASRSAFLTAFYVLFTPLFDWIVNRRRPPWPPLAGAPIALGGVALMTGGGWRGVPGLGDLVTLACAAMFAAQIVALGSALRRHRARQLLFLQIAVCGLLSLTAAPWLEAPRLVPTGRLIGAILFLGIVATVLLLGLQAYGQRHTTPTRAAILFSSEPVWAALFAALLGEQLATHEIAGAGLVLVGLVVATVPRTTN
jgi:drug/metabolite transporter (DMT)-like permease